MVFFFTLLLCNNLFVDIESGPHFMKLNRSIVCVNQQHYSNGLTPLVKFVSSAVYIRENCSSLIMPLRPFCGNRILVICIQITVAYSSDGDAANEISFSRYYQTLWSFPSEVISNLRDFKHMNSKSPFLITSDYCLCSMTDFFLHSKFYLKYSRI